MIRGLCSTCGSGTEPAGDQKLKAQARIFHGYCPVLKCAHNRKIAYCPRDCRLFPCDIFKQGPYPYSKGFLNMQDRRRKESRAPTLDLGQMAQWEQEEIFPGYWDELLSMDTVTVCERADVTYLQEEEAYEVRLLDRTYRLNPVKKMILSTHEFSDEPWAHSSVPFTEALILVVYLLKAANIPLARKQVSEKELPGGSLFFRGPHELTRKPVLSRYGEDPEAFQRAGLALDGKPVSAGDAGIRLQALPRIPLEYVLWAGDEEFPPSLTVLFDATISDHLPLDVIWALVHVVTNRLAEV